MKKLGIVLAVALLLAPSVAFANPTNFDIGTLLTQTGAGIKSAYGAQSPSAAFNPGRGKRLRVFVHVVTDPASTLTTITVKLRQRYRSQVGSTTTTLVDLPSYLDDVQGASQPKGLTREIEHAFTVSANGTFDFTFYLDDATAIPEMVIDTHGNTAGLGVDALTMYGYLGTP